MKVYLRVAVIALFLFPVWAVAHTTTLIPSGDRDGGRVIRVVHFNPNTGSNIMGIRLGAKDSKILKGLASIYVIHNGKKRDLSTIVLPDFFTVRDGKAESYTIPVSRRQGFSHAGDYVIVVEHQQHWKKSLGYYKQKVAKAYINNGGLLTDWPNRVLVNKPEIIPLVRPFAIFPGTLFRAEVVNGKGSKIPHARILIEFLNYKTSSAGVVSDTPIITQAERGIQTIFADSSGTFSFIPQVAGVWTFTLVDGDENLTIDGKELSYDSSISIHVKK